MRRKTDQENSEINLTPMLDVVFILLIFFIVTTSFARESAVTVARSDASDDPMVATALTIYVAANGALDIDGRRIETATITALVASAVLEDAALAVNVIADRSAPVETVVEVIDGVRQAGVAAVNLISSTSGAEVSR